MLSNRVSLLSKVSALKSKEHQQVPPSGSGMKVCFGWAGSLSGWGGGVCSFNSNRENVQMWSCFFHFAFSDFIWRFVCISCIFFSLCNTLFLSLHLNVFFDLLYFCQTLPLSPFQSLHLFWRMTLTSSCQRPQVNCVYIQLQSCRICFSILAQ